MFGLTGGVHPSPVVTITLTPSVFSAHRNASRTSLTTATFKAFAFFGRVYLMTAIASLSTLTATFSSCGGGEEGIVERSRRRGNG